MKDLDEARHVLPTRVIYYDNVDWPLYILHDIRSNGNSFSFGLCGRPLVAEPRSPLTYAEAARLIRKSEPEPYSPPLHGELFGAEWEAYQKAYDETHPLGVLIESDRGKEISQAGWTYALLLATVWEAFSAEPDTRFMGAFTTSRKKGQ